MKLSEHILVNHALAGEISSAARPIWDELVKEAATSTRIEIFSAYYGVKCLRQLLTAKTVNRRRTRRLTFLFGRKAAPALKEQLQQLIKFRKRLISAGYSSRNVRVALSPDSPFFHSKVYQFVRNTRRRTFIGSANASRSGLSTNEELLVSFDGRHAPLEHYLDQAWNAAEDVNELAAKLLRDGEQPHTSRSLREFLSDGLACNASRNAACINSVSSALFRTSFIFSVGSVSSPTERRK